MSAPTLGRAALVCAAGHRSPGTDWRCPRCGGPWECETVPPFDPSSIETSTWTLARYAAMLPVAPAVSLGEGGTPVIPVEIPEGRFLAKLEYISPTGSFKDRGTAVLVSHLREAGAGTLVDDSSGNAGASLAAYAAAARLAARIYVPAHASEAKRRQISAYGAEVVAVPGPRSAATEACAAAVGGAGTVYASHIWHPYVIAGQTTCAWELWEQLGGAVPDAVVCPVGQGNLFLGIARGFAALAAAGLTDRVPRMFAVQAAACAPVARAFRSGAPVPEPVVEGETVAEGIRSAVPVRGAELLRILAATGGAALAVDDDAVHTARHHLARAGLMVEPTSAVAAAALPAVRSLVGATATVVAPLTGSGLKSPPP